MTKSTASLQSSNLWDIWDKIHSVVLPTREDVSTDIISLGQSVQKSYNLLDNLAAFSGHYAHSNGWTINDDVYLQQNPNHRDTIRYNATKEMIEHVSDWRLEKNIRIAPAGQSDASTGIGIAQSTMRPETNTEANGVINSRNSREVFILSFIPIDHMALDRLVVLESDRVSDDDHFGINRRLEELKGLNDGWADGMQPPRQWGETYGKAPSDQGIDWLSEQLSVRYIQHNLPRLYLYPTPEGNIQIEWSIGANEIILEVDLTTHYAEWHATDIDTGQSVEKDISLDAPDAWNWLVNELLRLRSVTK